MEEKSKAIVLQEVTKTYSNAAGDFTALKGIDLSFDYGQFTSIVGKSGCGKSTLLNMITGIDYPTSGKVFVGGQDIYKMSESQRALWRGRTVGVVFQFFQLLPTLTVLENTLLPMDYCGIYNLRERPARAMALLEKIGLGEYADKLPANLSSGQQQSAAIARALATDPTILLADEPTGNLDSRSATAILDLFDELASQGKTILIVTHDPTITSRTEKTVILSDGEVIDQTVAQALPFLDHPQMLIATKIAQKQRFAPGSLIIPQGQRVDHFYMISSGEVEVFVNTKVPETMVARLGTGQFFGEISLITGANSIAGVRAGRQDSAEITRLPREAFLDLLKQSPHLAKAMNDVAQERRKETFEVLGRFR
jgi:ABC-type lipoprotein export system ATPase subunit